MINNRRLGFCLNFGTISILYLYIKVRYTAAILEQRNFKIAEKEKSTKKYEHNSQYQVRQYKYIDI